MTPKNFSYGAALLTGVFLTATLAHGQKLRMPPAGATPPATTATDAAKPDASATDSLAGAVPVAEIIVRINGQIISKQDLERSEQELNEQAKDENWAPDVVAHKKALLLSDLIDQQLLLSRGKELGVNPDDELIRRLDEIRKQNHMDSMEDLEKAARSQGGKEFRGRGIVDEQSVAQG